MHLLSKLLLVTQILIIGVKSIGRMPQMIEQNACKVKFNNNTEYSKAKAIDVYARIEAYNVVIILISNFMCLKLDLISERIGWSSV